MLTAGFSIPGCLGDAEQLKKEHEQFQTAIEVRAYVRSMEQKERIKTSNVTGEFVSQHSSVDEKVYIFRKNTPDFLYNEMNDARLNITIILFLCI